jgi:hypothetical protein
MNAERRDDDRCQQEYPDPTCDAMARRPFGRRELEQAECKREESRRSMDLNEQRRCQQRI